MNYICEGVSLSDNDYINIEKSILESYPKACILYVDRIVNERLEKRFLDLYESLKKKRPSTLCIKKLFHGTKSSNINSICNDGFKVSSNVRSAYGIGTYFSTKASYSRDYSDMDNDDVSYLFVSDVIIGNINVIGGSKQIPDGIDNSVDNIYYPTIYVCPYDNGCIPRFLVAFYKNAK